MKKTLVLSAIFVSLVALTLPRGVNALSSDDPVQNVDSSTAQTVRGGEKTAERASKVAEATVERTEKRDQIEQKMAEKHAAITEKLSGARAEKCSKKQDTINRILDTRIAAAQKHLERFSSIQDRLTDFVATKKLTIENGSALALIMDDKRTEAQASIDAIQTVDFSCNDADANAPGKIITEQISTTKSALKDYRTAIKDYAVVVKAAATEGEAR